MNEIMTTEQVQTEKKSTIPWPSDLKESVLIGFWGIILNYQKDNTRLSYSYELSQQDVKGLSQTTRDLERAINTRLDTYRRVYGTLHAALTSAPILVAQWLKYALPVVILFAVGGYLYAYPSVADNLYKTMVANSAQIVVTVLIFVAFIIFLLLRRRSRRKS